MPKKLKPDLGTELLFAGAVAQVKDEAGNGYLGSVSTIDAMLRSAAMDWIELLVDGTADLKQAKRIAQGVARTLLGMEPGFGLVPGWNAAGGIDEFLVRERGVKDKQPLARVEAVVVQFIRQITDIVNYADEPETTDEQWRWQMDAAFEEFALLFTGVPADAAELLGSPDAEASAETLQEGWVTINTGDDDEGGQRIYIDGSGKIQSGHFKGKTMKQAFGRKADSAKSDPEDKTPPPKDEPAKPTDTPAPDPVKKTTKKAKVEPAPKPPAEAAKGVSLQSWDQAGWKKAQADASATAKSTIGDWSAAADADQKAAVNWYQDGGFRAVNTQLRTGKAVDPNIAQQKKDWGRAFTNEELMAQMDGLMAKTKATKDFAAYRGVGADEAKALLAMKPGESFTRPDYVSTSLNPNLAYSSFANPSVGGGNVLMKINGKAGTPAMYLGDTENEALLGRGNSFVLKSKSKATGPNGQEFDVLEFDIADAKKPATPVKAAGAPSPVSPTPAAKPKAPKSAKPKQSGGVPVTGLTKDAMLAYRTDYVDALDAGEDEILNLDMKTQVGQVEADPKTGFKIPVKGDAHYDDYQKMIKYQLAMASMVGGSENAIDPKDYELAIVPTASLQRSQAMADFINDSSQGQSKRIGKWLATGRAEDYAPPIVDASGVILDGNHRLASRTLANIPYMAVLRPKAGSRPDADDALVRTLPGKDEVKYKVGVKGVSMGNAISAHAVERAIADGPEGIKSLMSIAHPEDKAKLQAKFAARGVDVGSLKESESMLEPIDPSLERAIIDGLRPIADGLISVVVTDQYLVGNFGDWADSEAFDTFKAVAESVGLVPETEDEAGDLLSIEKYKDGHEIELDVPPTLTQESFKNWTNYP